METIVVKVINLLGSLGEKGAHFVLDAFEVFVTNSTTKVDNTLFYKVILYVKSWEPKNFTE